MNDWPKCRLCGKYKRHRSECAMSLRNRPKSRPPGLRYSAVDAHWIEAASWCLGGRYAMRRRNGAPEYLHRLVGEKVVGRALRAGDVVDHVNGDTLDNRRENLRVVTSRENAANRTVLNPSNQSGFRGVSYCTQTGRWKAVVTIDRRQHWLGRFDTADEAAAAARDYRLANLSGATS